MALLQSRLLLANKSYSQPVNSQRCANMESRDKGGNNGPCADNYTDIELDRKQSTKLNIAYIWRKQALLTAADLRLKSLESQAHHCFLVLWQPS